MLVHGGCGGRWSEADSPHRGARQLDCEHATTNCDSCHPADEPLADVDAACLACHTEDRPASHDPLLTAQCDDCHSARLYTDGRPVDLECDWGGVSPHPAGFSEPAAHGIDANLQGAVEGDCRDCHGPTLTGGTSPEGASARGCDDCHAANGAAEWRSDCTFCHGGDVDLTGAPPHDIDGAEPLSLPSHAAHVRVDGPYRALACTDCHPADVADALDPDHWFDTTPGVSEVSFARSIAPATTWDGTTCADSYCHGQGTRPDGVIQTGDGPLTCDGCHATTAGWEAMSGFHAAHLGLDGKPIACNDCHAAVIDADDGIDSPARHVDGQVDVSFVGAEVTRDSVTGTCTGDCHGADHRASGWGHPPDYAEPDQHGLDANLQTSDCGTCHGSDLRGGVASGCDDCHTTEGHADWRTDCTFCHGGTLDASGGPPEDIDGATSGISFEAHFAHEAAGRGTVGHPDYDCTECHALITDVLTPGHALDETAGRGEVDLSGGWAPEAGYDPVSQACSNVYCHGNGRAPSGVISDGATALDCDSCHSTTATWDALSGTHDVHLGAAGVTCADCHGAVVDASGTVVDPDAHIDRQLQVDEGTGWSAATTTCTVECHGTTHRDWAWPGGHGDGFDDGDAHGPEALLRLQDCQACHGTDLTGGTASGCDDCHAKEGHKDWRADCTFCHGGAAGDTTGVPPVDVDGTSDEASISLASHPEHVTSTVAADLDCVVCHSGAQDYVEAVSDAGHWLTGDTTPTVGEVAFTGLGLGTNYAASTCSDSYCHGNGQADGVQIDANSTLSCDGCHAYAFDRTDLSGTHALHLSIASPVVTCADCHSVVVDAAGTVVDRAAHVDGVIDVDATTTVGWDAPSESCTNACHGRTHTSTPWPGGHAKGYDAATAHGTDALMQTTTCADGGCHGSDLQGGASGVGCDSCHTKGWRSDCTYCHGGASGDTTGIPPEDLDNTSSDAAISFKAHSEHADNDDHIAYDCDACHGATSVTYSDALTDWNHWWDASAGEAEVYFTGGLGAGGSYDATTATCSDVYCHGSGLQDGDIADSTTALGCDDCHSSPPDITTGSDEHTDHDHDGVSCDWCHDSVAASSTTLSDPDLHVDGKFQVSFSSDADQWGGMGFGVGSCSGECHVGTNSHVHKFEIWQ